MKSIDFLPDIYRQREALRRARLWWAMVVVIFSCAIGASAGAQAWLRHGLAQQLEALTPEYATLVRYVGRTDARWWSPMATIAQYGSGTQAAVPSCMRSPTSKTMRSQCAQYP